MGCSRFNAWLAGLFFLSFVFALPHASSDGSGIGYLLGTILGAAIGYLLISGLIPLLWLGAGRRFEIARARGPLLLWTLLLLAIGTAQLLGKVAQNL